MKVSKVSRLRAALAPLSILAASACGASAPPPKPPEPAPVPQDHGADLSGMKMHGDLGLIDKEETDQTLHGLSPAFQKCQTDRLEDVAVLSGAVKFFIRVGENGMARFAYFEASDLGDRVAEKCMLDAITATQFPKPEGGEAEVRYGIELPQHSERVPDSWSADKVADAKSAAESCTSGASSTAQVTAYVVADDTRKKGGKALAVGVAFPEEGSDGKIDCIVKAVKAAKLPSPGSFVAKVSFSL